MAYLREKRDSERQHGGIRVGTGLPPPPGHHQGVGEADPFQQLPGPSQQGTGLRHSLKPQCVSRSQTPAVGITLVPGAEDIGEPPTPFKYQAAVRAPYSDPQRTLTVFLMSPEGGWLGQRECQASSELTVHFWASGGGHRGAPVSRGKGTGQGAIITDTRMHAHVHTAAELSFRSRPTSHHWRPIIGSRKIRFH